MVLLVSVVRRVRNTMMLCLPPQGTPPPHSSRYGPQHIQHTASTAATPRYLQGRRQPPADVPTPLKRSMLTSFGGPRPRVGARHSGATTRDYLGYSSNNDISAASFIIYKLVNKTPCSMISILVSLPVLPLSGVWRARTRSGATTRPIWATAATTTSARPRLV